MTVSSACNRGYADLESLDTALKRATLPVPLQTLGQSRLPVRPLPKTISSEFVVYLGSEETYGRYVAKPFPSVVEAETGVQCVNLGCVGSSIDTFLQAKEIADLCSNAQLAVIEIMGAEAMSNRLYRVDPKNNQNLVRASRYLKALYPEIDFAVFRTVSELLTALAQTSNEKFYFVKLELHAAWVARMRTLISEIRVPAILLWIADHEPYYAETGGTVLRDPLFVDRTMIEAVRHEVVDIVEFVARPSEIQRDGSARSTVYGSQTAATESFTQSLHNRIGAGLSPIVQEVVAILRKEHPYKTCA